MGRDRFVSGNTVKLELSEGDWIIVKERLTYGEQQRIITAGFKSMSARPGVKDQDVDVAIDWDRTNLVRLKTWLVGWSFTRDNKQVAITEAAIAALDPDTVEEIDAALSAHIEAIDAQKKATETPGEPSG